MDFSFANATSLSKLHGSDRHTLCQKLQFLHFQVHKYILSTLGLLATLVTIACSRPPLPNYRTFMIILLYVMHFLFTDMYGFARHRTLFQFAIRSIACGIIFHSALLHEHGAAGSPAYRPSCNFYRFLQNDRTGIRSLIHKNARWHL